MAGSAISQQVLLGMGSGVAAPGQQLFTANGSFVVPNGITSISAVCVGAGLGGNTQDGGRGGDLRYITTLSVTPGETLTITVGASGTFSRIARGGTTLLEARGGSTGTSTTIAGDVGGGNGGAGGDGNASSWGSGGGAGGYSGNGGAGVVGGGNGNAGAGGAGGSGAGNEA